MSCDDVKKGHNPKKRKAPTKKKTEPGFFLEIFKIHSFCGEFQLAAENTAADAFSAG
jgi:hypothetical protein